MNLKKMIPVLLCVCVLAAGQKIISNAAELPGDEMIREAAEAKEIKKLEITGFPKTIYYQYIDTRLSYDGLSVKVTYEDGSVETVEYGKKDSQNHEMTVTTVLNFETSETELSYPFIVTMGGKNAVYTATYRDFENVTSTAVEFGKRYEIGNTDYAKGKVYQFTTGRDGGMVMEFFSEAEYRIYKSDDMRQVRSWVYTGSKSERQVIELIPETEYYLIVNPITDALTKSYGFCVRRREPLEQIEIAALPAKTRYPAGTVSAVDYSGLQLRLHYANGYEETVQGNGRTLQGDSFLIWEDFKYDDKGMILPGTYEMRVYPKNQESIFATFQISVLGKMTDFPGAEVTPTPGYTGEEVKQKADLSKAEVKLSRDFVDYTGKEQKPSVRVICAGKIIGAENYTVSYRNNKSIGTASVTVTGIGNYTGSKTAQFTITPGKVTGVKVKSGRKCVTVSWKKRREASGYEIYISEKKASGYKKKAILGKSAKVKKVIKKMKAKKSYYVKVRAFTKVKGRKINGSFSSPKKVKVK